MTVFAVPDMSCNHCKVTIEATLATVPQVGEVKVDLTNRRVEVTGPAPAAEVLKALDRAGYPATVA